MRERERDKGLPVAEGEQESNRQSGIKSLFHHAGYRAGNEGFVFPFLAIAVASPNKWGQIQTFNLLSLLMVSPLCVSYKLLL